jgi:acyl-CoA reductase-like NAD-dependent aldehyde dehydrogenase
MGKQLLGAQRGIAVQVLRWSGAAASYQDVEFTHTIDGEARRAQHTFDVINPATGRVLARCPDSSRADIDAAVRAARRAFAGWSSLSLPQRREYLLSFAATIEKNAVELAELLTQEQGKPLANARRELQNSAHHVRTIAALEIKTEVLEDSGGSYTELRYRPMGVCVGITPWNVPIGIGSVKVAQALYAGNTMVLKPSPLTPLTTLKLGELSRATLPPGVFNVVAGGNDVGAWLTAHSDVDKISFTGSLPTGRKVLGASAVDTLKRVTLELGGNDAAIVLDDVDVESMAPRLFAAAFANCGQICMAIKRLYVHESIYEQLCAALAELARTARVGDGRHPQVQIGPIQNKLQYERVLGLIADTRSRPGVRILAGGAACEGEGYFIAPTIVADIAEGAPLVDEEQFGPVLPVLHFSDVQDAIRRANATRFGLSGSIWSADVDRATRLAAQLEVGTAWINRHIGADAAVPLGGAKDSGIGREHGLLGLHSYLEPQVLQIAR